MAINYKNVVSVQKITGITSGISGYTLANGGASGDVGFGVITSPQNIIKHRGFILVPAGVTGPVSVFPTYFGADGLTLSGTTLTAGGALGAQYPLQVPLRMKTFTGLTGGSILFVV
jgi:hypothetical protein